jgi:hypothetical protein
MEAIFGGKPLGRSASRNIRWGPAKPVSNPFIGLIYTTLRVCPHLSNPLPQISCCRRLSLPPRWHTCATSNPECSRLPGGGARGARLAPPSSGVRGAGPAHLTASPSTTSSSRSGAVYPLIHSRSSSGRSCLGSGECAMVAACPDRAPPIAGSA